MVIIKVNISESNFLLLGEGVREKLNSSLFNFFYSHESMGEVRQAIGYKWSVKWVTFSEGFNTPGIDLVFDISLSDKKPPKKFDWRKKIIKPMEHFMIAFLASHEMPFTSSDIFISVQNCNVLK